MNKLDELFSRKSRNVLAVYITAGFPQTDSLAEIVESLQDAGVDIIEVGMPFSDPLADGEVIQHTSQIAVKNGMNMQRMFDQLAQMKDNVNVPLVLMGYLNPVLSFGMENFLRCAASTGISAVILPDLPPEVYELEYRLLFAQYGLHIIFLVTPSTPDSRITRLASLSGGFLYAVAEAGVTGSQTSFPESRKDYLQKVKSLAGELPVLAGFGIHNRQTFRAVCEFTNGAITGSAFLRALNNEKPIRENVRQFVQQLISTTHDCTVEK
jgi:tryptophan synthase alpha chain